MVLVDDGREPDPRRPRGLLDDPGPVDAVGGAPYVVVGLVRRQVVAAAEDPELAVEGHGPVVRPRLDGAWRVTSFQWTPSVELQTSFWSERSSPKKYCSTPPRIHILPSSTTPAAPSRGLQPAFSVAHFHSAPSVEHQTWLLAEASGFRPPYQPPMIHILSSKTSVVGRSAWTQGAWGSRASSSRRRRSSTRRSGTGRRS